MVAWIDGGTGRDFESFLGEVRPGVDDFGDSRVTASVVVVGFLNVDGVLKPYVVARVMDVSKIISVSKVVDVSAVVSAASAVDRI